MDISLFPTVILPFRSISDSLKNKVKEGSLKRTTQFALCCCWVRGLIQWWEFWGPSVSWKSLEGMPQPGTESLATLVLQTARSGWGRGEWRGSVRDSGLTGLGPVRGGGCSRAAQLGHVGRNNTNLPLDSPKPPQHPLFGQLKRVSDFPLSLKWLASWLGSHTHRVHGTDWSAKCSQQNLTEARTGHLARIDC